MAQNAQLKKTQTADQVEQYSLFVTQRIHGQYGPVRIVEPLPIREKKIDDGYYRLQLFDTILSFSVKGKIVTLDLPKFSGNPDDMDVSEAFSHYSRDILKQAFGLYLKKISHRLYL